VLLCTPTTSHPRAAIRRRYRLVIMDHDVELFSRALPQWPALSYSPEAGLIYESRFDGLGIIDPRMGRRPFDVHFPNVLDGEPAGVRDGVIYALGSSPAILYALRHP